jgi:hypothetical protein
MPTKLLSSSLGALFEQPQRLLVELGNRPRVRPQNRQDRFSIFDRHNLFPVYPSILVSAFNCPIRTKTNLVLQPFGDTFFPEDYVNKKIKICHFHINIKVKAWSIIKKYHHCALE